MRNQIKLEFLLKQHTPLIHFQHTQEGATIRVTELKPKLDKFLILEKREEVKDIIKITKSGTEYLDYKIKVERHEKVVEIDIPIRTYNGNNEVNYPFVLANLGKNEDSVDFKKFSYFKGPENEYDLKVTIISFQSTLLSVIESNFNEFLFKHNFGNRQSKGFGSFYRMNESITSFKANYPYFIIKSGDITKVFNEINLFYRCLRSGINQKTSKEENGETIMLDAYYFKSLMFMYAKSEGLTWDKRTLRENFYLNRNKYTRIKEARKDIDGTVQWQSIDKKEYLFRDLLGLSSRQEWKYYDNDVITKKDKNKEKDDTEVIQRFKSPIIFKPFKEGNGFCIFIIFEKIPPEFKNTTFIVKSDKTISKELQIYPNFDLKKFFEFCVNLDIDSHFQVTDVAKQKHKDEIATIKAIFNELKTTLK